MFEKKLAKVLKMRKSGKLWGKGHKTPGPGVQGRFSEMFSCSCVRWESHLPTYLVVTGVGAKDTIACKKRKQTLWQISYVNNFLYIRLCRVDRSTLAEDWWSALGGGSPWLITYKGVAPTQHFFPQTFTPASAAAFSLLSKETPGYCTQKKLHFADFVCYYCTVLFLSYWTR